MTAVVTLPRGVELCHLPARFPLARGGALAGASLAFERVGPTTAPVVVVLGGISAGRHVAAHAAAPERGWWDGFVGAGAPIDTDRVQVLSFDWLGGVGGSTAPARGEAFPFVDAADQAAALWALCDALRIERLHAIVGASYGGMVALHAAAQQPARVRRLAALGAAHRSHPQASAWRAVQRGIVELGARTGQEAAALQLARALALTTYRTPGELLDRFGGDAALGVGRAALGEEHARLRGDGALAAGRVATGAGGAGLGTVPGEPRERLDAGDGRAVPPWRTPVEDWLDARGADFAARWHAAAFLCLNRSIDAHRIDPRTVTVPTALLAFVGDQLVPPPDVRELALALPDLRAHRDLRSRYGHDAFLKERVHVGAFVREVLS